ncbi:MAG: bifunctional 4-hydroxy-2-oxoglutarate aldolase/2-dehydro-3-deoxy-phosphogluconate aldolase [Balneolales bacterium]
MARFTRIKVATVMAEIGLVPLFYHHDIEICEKVLTACYNGGARLLEFTNRGDYAHEVFSQLNKFAESNLPDMILGVGSITDAGAASLYMQLGANFVVTPVLREDIAIVCNRRKLLWSPGCGSLTEVAKAEELGAEIIKIFPGSLCGPEFVKAIKAPCPWTSIMPTGGVSTSRENLKMWFDSGVTCVGIGSQLITSENIKNQDFKSLENQVSSTLQVIQSIRNK